MRIHFHKSLSASDLMLSLTFAYLINGKLYPVVIICISLIASEVAHLFMHLLAY